MDNFDYMLVDTSRVGNIKRKPNWSEGENRTLVEEFCKRKHYVRPKAGISVSSRERQNAWLEITEAVNRAGASTMNTGGGRTMKEVQKKWENLCSRMKQEVAENACKPDTAGNNVAAFAISPLCQAIQLIVGDDEPSLEKVHSMLRTECGPMDVTFQNSSHYDNSSSCLDEQADDASTNPDPDADPESPVDDQQSSLHVIDVRSIKSEPASPVSKPQLTLVKTNFVPIRPRISQSSNAAAASVRPVSVERVYIPPSQTRSSNGGSLVARSASKEARSAAIMSVNDQRETSPVILDDDDDFDTGLGNSFSVGGKRRRVANDSFGDVQSEVLQLKRQKIMFDIEKIALEKEKLVLEKEKLLMEKETLALQKEKMRLELAKLRNQMYISTNR